jgi:drug/metabolite transporter (DMT)-like permease
MLNWMIMLQIISIYFIFALTFVLGKLSINFIDPLLLIALRMIIAGVILTTYCLVKKIKFPNILNIAVLSLVHIAIPYCFEFLAFAYSSASKVAFIFNLTPLLTGLVQSFYFKKKLTKSQWLAIFIAFIATSLFTVADLKSNCPKFDSTIFSEISICEIGELLLFTAVFSSVIGWLIINKMMQSGNSITAINATSMLGGGLISLTAYFSYSSYGFADLNYTSWFYVFSLLILGNIISYNMYGWLLKIYDASYLALWGSICPLMVAAIESLVYGQKPSTNFIIASLGIAISIKIFMSKNIKK